MSPKGYKVSRCAGEGSGACSREQARLAIMRFVKTNQYQAKFNPDDKAHITAYMQLRQFTPRVTPEALA